jgi:putative flippase GtrA
VPRSEVARFARFITTSGTSAVVNLATRWLLSLVLPYEAAVALAYLVGMVTAFLLARLFVFEQAAGSMHGQFARYTLVNAVGFTQVWLVSVGLARLAFPAVGFTWNAEIVAHATGLSSLTATAYFLHKRFSFRSARA